MKKINNILVAIDNSAMSREALKRAVSIAKEKEAQLVVMHVIEAAFIFAPFVQGIDARSIEKEVKIQVEEITSKENVEYILFVESGSPSSSIAHKVRSTGVDLLIIGTHGKDDINSNYFGSTTLKLIQKTRIPVLIVKNETKHAYKKMLAPTNLSDYSKESILFANELFSKPSRKYLYAFETMSELSAMTYHISEEDRVTLEVEMFTKAKVALADFVKELAKGETALMEWTAFLNEDLLAYIIKDRADLLVLGSKGVGNLNSFVFGSTASYLVQSSPIDVLVHVPVTTQPKSKEKSTEK